MNINRKITVIIVSIIPLFAAISGCSDPASNTENAVDKARQHIVDKDYRTAFIELKSALQSTPDHAEARFLLGKINLDIGEYQAAIKEFDHVLSSGFSVEEANLLKSEALLHQQAFSKITNETPSITAYSTQTRANLLAIKAIAYFATEQLNLAEQALNEAEQLAANAQWVLFAKIRRNTLIDNLDAANDYLTTALELYPSSQDFWLARAELSERKQDPHEVQAALNQVITLDPVNLTSAKGWRARITLVKLHIAEGRIDDASATLKPLAKLNPRHPEVNYFSGLIAFRQNEMDQAEEKLLKVVKSVPDHPPSMFLLGTLQYGKRNYEQAVYYLLSYLSSVPSHVEARKLLGRTYIALGQPDEARTILRYNESGAMDPEVIALIGLSELQGGDIKQGIDSLEQSVQSSPDDPTLRFSLIRAYIANGQSNKAIKELDKLQDHPEVSHIAAQMRILAYVYDKNFTKAIELANALSEKREGDEKILGMLASIYLAKNDFEKGREYLTKAIAANGSYVPAIMELGRLNERENRLDEAKANYEQALNVRGNSVTAMMALARVYNTMGDKEAFGQWLSKSSEASPDQGLPEILLAEHYLKQNNFEQAETIINQLAQDYPEHPMVMTLQGQLLTSTGRFNQAISVLDKLANANPELFAAHQLLGDAYIGLNEYKNASSHYQTAVDIDDSNAVILNNLAWVYDQLGDSRSLPTAEKAHAIDDQNPYIKDTFGWILVKNGEPARGHALLSQASSSLPNLPDVSYRLAIATIKIGEKETGKRMIEELVNSNVEFQYREEALKLLNDSTSQ